MDHHEQQREEAQPLADDGSNSSGYGQKPAQPRTPQTKRAEPAKKEEPVLRYRKTPIVLLALYLATLIVPWVLTCILDDRSLTTSGYYDQRGRVDANSYLSFWSLLAFIKALQSISGILTIPVTTTILAYAAVTFAQNRFDGQRLSMSQLFALTDRGWADITILWRAGSNGRSSGLLWYGALMVAIGAIQQPLQNSLVRLEPIIALSCSDLPVGGCGTRAYRVGFDADLWALPLVDHNIIVRDVVNTLATFDDTQIQHNLWVDNPYGPNLTTQWLDPTNYQILMLYGSDDGTGNKSHPDNHFFVTSLPNGTHTGVLREHALRLNSSVTCQNISRSSFPSPCEGLRPLDVSIRRPNLEIRVCAPGEIGKYPWSMSRNRETIEEELYIDLQSGPDIYPSLTTPADNYTMKCTASTTRGYFELGNYMNEFVYGPLLDQWPDEETIERDTNNWLPVSDGRARPKEIDDGGPGWDFLPFKRSSVDPFAVGSMNSSGPLMMAANALFGNASFLQMAYNSSAAMSPGEMLGVMCAFGNMPFDQVLNKPLTTDEPNDICYRTRRQPMDDDRADDYISQLLATWTSYFGETYVARDLLEIALFLVNRAMLEKTIAGEGVLFAREIYSAPGTLFAKPTKSLASTIGISILIGLQTAGLVAAVWYSRKAPTWTATFDSMAMARIGRAMKDGDLPLFGPATDQDKLKLRKVNALVGIVDSREPEGDEETSAMKPADQTTIHTFDSQSTHPRKIQLGLGGEGKINRSHAPPSKMRRWKKNKSKTQEGSLA